MDIIFIGKVLLISGGLDFIVSYFYDQEKQLDISCS
jgi:hypothetical protein